MTDGNFKDKEITTLTNLSLKNLTKIDVSNNLLQDFDGIDACKTSLKWLNASNNQISCVEKLKVCKQLKVLNLGKNKISSVGHLSELKTLNALILNNNDLTDLDGIQQMEELNTLVVSGNELDTLCVSPLAKLQKLSASKNKLQAFPDIRGLKSIGDVKLNHNEIALLPEWLSRCTRLKVMDLGNNCLKDFDSIDILGKMSSLENLNLRGNPVCDEPDYVIKIKALLPNLKILDYKKLSELYFKAIEEKSKAESSSLKSSKAVISKQNEKPDTTQTNIVNRGFKKNASLVTSENEMKTDKNEKDVVDEKRKKNKKKKKKNSTKQTKPVSDDSECNQQDKENGSNEERQQDDANDDGDISNNGDKHNSGDGENDGDKSTVMEKGTNKSTTKVEQIKNNKKNRKRKIDENANDKEFCEHSEESPAGSHNQVPRNHKSNESIEEMSKKTENDEGEIGRKREKELSDQKVKNKKKKLTKVKDNKKGKNSKSQKSGVVSITRIKNDIRKKNGGFAMIPGNFEIGGLDEDNVW